MNKYNQIIDLNNKNNSISIILNNIKSNSCVLEFGSANGYMTKYLKETLKCFTCIVELDLEDGLEASKFSDMSFIGSHNGDIEKYYWLKSIDKKFDYIIFSDVLEHLKNPLNVLKESLNLLKEDGSILISIPNISHNSVIIDLINNKFEYREFGLLDNTHIRFFTRNSLLKMIKDVDLYIEKEMNTFCSVEHTEFNNTMEDIPKEISDFLNKREDGILYQFVWELKKKK